jgi:molecular chaperone GrpE
MENHKHDHPGNHNHKHGADHAGHKHQNPGADEEVDLENLKAGAQAQPAAEAKPQGDIAENKPGRRDAETKDQNASVKTQDASAKAADVDLQKQQQEIDELKSKIEAGNDKYLRLMAEFDNFKRRTAKEYPQLIEQANEKLMKEIIEVRENFDRAFKHHKPGEDQTAFVDGMRLIFTKLDSILHKHGLEVYCEPGQAFNPEFHDAMMKCPQGEIPEDHIAEVLEKGYTLKGKVIKHARVIVSCGKPPVPAAPGQEKNNDAGSGEDEAVIEVAVDKNGKGQEKKQG